MGGCNSNEEETNDGEKKKGYKFGDVHREVYSDKSWKEKSGRKDGKEGYQRGDIVRTLKRAAVENEWVLSWAIAWC